MKGTKTNFSLKVNTLSLGIRKVRSKQQEGFAKGHTTTWLVDAKQEPSPSTLLTVVVAVDSLPKLLKERTGSYWQLSHSFFLPVLFWPSFSDTLLWREIFHISFLRRV